MPHVGYQESWATHAYALMVHAYERRSWSSAHSWSADRCCTRRTLGQRSHLYQLLDVAAQSMHKTCGSIDASSPLYLYLCICSMCMPNARTLWSDSIRAIVLYLSVDAFSVGRQLATSQLLWQFLGLAIKRFSVVGVTWILLVACDRCGSGPAMVSKILRSHLNGRRC